MCEESRPFLKISPFFDEFCEFYDVAFGVADKLADKAREVIRKANDATTLKRSLSEDNHESNSPMARAKTRVQLRGMTEMCWCFEMYCDALLWLNDYDGLSESFNVFEVIGFQNLIMTQYEAGF